MVHLGICINIQLLLYVNRGRTIINSKGDSVTKFCMFNVAKRFSYHLFAVSSKPITQINSSNKVKGVYNRGETLIKPVRTFSNINNIDTLFITSHYYFLIGSHRRYPGRHDCIKRCLTAHLLTVIVPIFLSLTARRR